MAGSILLGICFDQNGKISLKNSGYLLIKFTHYQILISIFIEKRSIAEIRQKADIVRPHTYNSYLSVKSPIYLGDRVFFMVVDLRLPTLSLIILYFSCIQPSRYWEILCFWMPDKAVSKGFGSMITTINQI
jgi:hypothetical protein